LTQKRAKPAVPLGGKYRLVDIPISNCLNSGFRQVYVLNQFNSEALHRHITGSYKFDGFTNHDDINNLEELEMILRASPRAQSLSANLWECRERRAPAAANRFTL
jgi:ADP-glucose pyrophosphorylase